MNWKGILLILSLVGLAVGLILTAKANEEIRRLKFESDSIALARDSAYRVRIEESDRLQDSLDKLQQNSIEANKKAEQAIASASTLKAQRNAILAVARSAQDSLLALPVEIRRGDSLEVAVESLKSKSRSDSLRLKVLTIDRDEWRWEADSLRLAMLKINTNVGDVAEAAERKVNLGILKVPVNVMWGVAGMTLGYGVRAATSY